DVADDARVIERGEGQSLSGEPPGALRIIGARGRQDLERDPATELEVVCGVHHAHPAGADPQEDLEPPEPLGAAVGLAAGRLRLREMGDRTDERVDLGSAAACLVVVVVPDEAHAALLRTRFYMMRPGRDLVLADAERIIAGSGAMSMKAVEAQI